jgi:hypothetical protein
MKTVVDMLMGIGLDQFDADAAPPHAAAGNGLMRSDVDGGGEGG